MKLAFLKNGAPQCTVVEPQGHLESQSNILESNDNSLVVKQEYAVKWHKDKVDLVKLAQRHYIDQMSYREIAANLGITRGQVDWNLRKIKSTIPSIYSLTPEEIIQELEQRAKDEEFN